jgi:hypothetical protein
MTSFVRYYKDRKLKNITMTEIENMIKDRKNQKIIAEYVYERFYNRFLKIFDFPSEEKADYIKDEKIETKNIFAEEYKNGFLMMSSCSLLIETFASFLVGQNETPQNKNIDMFIRVFEKAEEYGNDLKIFKDKPFYKKIRCGLLHQGETYGKYKITRKGELYKDDTINANIFFVSLKKMLVSYKKELEDGDWDSKEWDACRLKIRHIVSNAKK